MLDEIDSHELAEWMAYATLEPFGEERADIRAAIVARECAAPWRKQPPELDDFLPFRDKPEQTPEEMKRVLERAKGFAK